MKSWIPVIASEAVNSRTASLTVPAAISDRSNFNTIAWFTVPEEPPQTALSVGPVPSPLLVALPPPFSFTWASPPAP